MSDGLDFLDEITDLEQEDPDYVPESKCHVCGAIFGPADTGHCSPITGGCCQNFASTHAFDRHLKHSKDWREVRCLTVAERVGRGPNAAMLFTRAEADAYIAALKQGRSA